METGGPAWRCVAARGGRSDGAAWQRGATVSSSTGAQRAVGRRTAEAPPGWSWKRICQARAWAYIPLNRVNGCHHCLGVVDRERIITQNREVRGSNHTLENAYSRFPAKGGGCMVLHRQNFASANFAWAISLFFEATILWAVTCTTDFNPFILTRMGVRLPKGQRCFSARRHFEIRSGGGSS